MSDLPQWLVNSSATHDCTELRQINSDAGNDWNKVHVVFYEGRWMASDLWYDNQILVDLNYCPFCGCRLSSIAR